MTEPLLNLARTLGEDPLPQLDAVVGFDGFVDRMIRVIGAGVGATSEPIPTIDVFAEEIRRAAGRSFGREIKVTAVEPGGNAPNLASGLSTLGVNVDFYGTLGQPMHPIFADFAQRCRSCTTLGGCGETYAFEFDDGKLMFNETSAFDAITGEVIAEECRAGLRDAIASAQLIGLANWSRYPHMTSCWEALRDGALDANTSQPWVLVDLADPSTRRQDDVDAMLDVLRSMRPTARVLLGVNRHEASVLLGTSGQIDDDEGAVRSAAEELRRSMGFDGVALHAHQSAALCLADAPVASCRTAHTSRPIRTTGVGDRFNAGLALGLITGRDPMACLLMGCAAGAWFVRRGTEPTRADLARLCECWAQGAPDAVSQPG